MKKLYYRLCLALLCLSGLPLQTLAIDCDPCAGMVWNTPVTTTYTFMLPHRPGCMYKLYLTYQTRQCQGMTQVEILSAAYEDLNGGNPNCMLNCLVDGAALHRIAYNYLLSLVPGPVLKVEPSPCYYTGTVTIPAAARVCMGMQPGSTVTVYMPCDNNGCCYSHLTPVNSITYHQQVIYSTPCPAAPAVPPVTTTLFWSCDIVGGGIATFSVTFTPDPNPVCFTTCYTGYARKAPPATVQVEKGGFRNLQLYPNPAKDQLHVGFWYEKEGDEVKVELFDAAGRTVAQALHTTAAGDQSIELNTATLVPGTYGCRIIYGANSIVTKVVKQ